MIGKFEPGQSPLELKCDLAGSSPVYIYYCDDKKSLFYSTSIMDLLRFVAQANLLKLSERSISYLLQCGVVPPPHTAYENLYLLGVGDKAKITTVDGNVHVQFFHEFPFLGGTHCPKREIADIYDSVSEKLFEAISSRVRPDAATFLFHSAGKDSNGIAIALAEGGWQNKVTFVTYKSNGKYDESVISKNIAAKLGFNHRVITGAQSLADRHMSSIEKYFEDAPFPCLDNAALAYPIYLADNADMSAANLIDGMGNDVYMKRDLSAFEDWIFGLSRFTSNLSFLRKSLRSERLVSPFFRTQTEWCGMSGFTFYDAKKIYPSTCYIYDELSREAGKRKGWDAYDFKGDMGVAISTEMYTRKIRNFADVVGGNLILPWADEAVTRLFLTLPEEDLLDRKTRRNKVVLRNMLRDKIDLDSDALGKFGFKFDFGSIVLKNSTIIFHEILSCSIWDRENMLILLRRLESKMFSKTWQGSCARKLLYRLYLLSGWCSRNRYINTGGY